MNNEIKKNELLSLLKMRKNYPWNQRKLNMQQICTKLNITDRDVRSLVHDLRLEGYPVASGDFGYVYCNNLRELNELWANRYEIELKKAFKILDMPRRHFEQGNQMELAL